MDKKKFRQKYNLFLVEGNKTLKEIPNSQYQIKEVFCLDSSELPFENIEVTQVSPAELKKISFLQHPKDSVAVCEIREEKLLTNVPKQLVLDGIQDPGNLGTLIRLADWFGIDQIICSEDTVDFYNPKVIQASMGSFLRVNIVYQDLESYLAENTQPIIGTDMNGTSFYEYPFPKNFNLVLATAQAGEMLGNQLIYLEAGSGAKQPVPLEMIQLIAQNINIPIIVGGGIVDLHGIQNAYKAGADLVVIGTAFENDSHFFES